VFRKGNCQAGIHGQVQSETGSESPVSGYITERNALPNLAVQPETRLYTVADFPPFGSRRSLSKRFGKDQGRRSRALTVNTYPGRVFEGSVNFIYPRWILVTRTARARLTFSNSGLKLSPGMFVQRESESPDGEPTVTRNRFLQSGTREIAFVTRSDG